MSSTIIRDDFIQRVLRRLNEAASSPIGELTDGSGGTALTTAQTIADYATEGVSVLCRTCWPLRASFTRDIATVTPRIAYQDLAAGSDAPSGAVCWQALKDGVIWTPLSGDPTRLTYCTESALAMRYRDYLTAAAGTPTHWYPLGGEGVGLYPAAGNSGSLTVHGLYVAPAADTGPMFPTLPDDLLSPYIEAYVCRMLALKNRDDALLAQTASLWTGEFEQGRAALYARLDPALRACFPPFAPSIGANSTAGGGNG